MNNNSLLESCTRNSVITDVLGSALSTWLRDVAFPAATTSCCLCELRPFLGQGHARKQRMRNSCRAQPPPAHLALSIFPEGGEGESRGPFMDGMLEAFGFVMKCLVWEVLTTAIRYLVKSREIIFFLLTLLFFSSVHHLYFFWPHPNALAVFWA